MQLSQFNYHLPDELIAQSPSEPRDQARLLVYDRLSDEITHATVADINRFLPINTTLVANNSRVRKARLYAKLGEKPVEIVVVEPAGNGRFRCLLGGRNIRSGDELTVYTNQTREEVAGLTARVEEREDGAAMHTYLLSFDGTETPETAFERVGHTPLPPYIKSPTSRDERYQTVFAKQIGSAAAPTAGLHFTPELIASLEAAGHNWREVTLHVGLGTFLPLRNEDVTANRLHREQTSLSPELAAELTQAVSKHQPILSIGTTSTRTLESHWQGDTLQPGSRQTDLFIYPGYTFRVPNLLVTNFHLPRSSLLLLVAAFLGNHPSERSVCLSEEDMVARLHRIYSEAIRQGYRFYSFGDTMLIR